MESRLMFAYALIAAIVLVASVSGVIWARKRKARNRRLRGIKSYTPASGR